LGIVSAFMRIWSIIFLVGFVVFCVIRGAFKQRTKGNESVVSRADGVEKALLLLLAPGTLVLPLLYLFTSWLGFADYRLPAPAMYCGVGLMIVALWVFWRSHVDLGQNWSQTLELRKGHQLVKHGIYRSIRHPMYAAIWLWCVAQGLLLENWLAGWWALAAFAVMYFVRTPREEQMMHQFLGEEYRDYVRQTGRIFPRVRMRTDA
jgi:protein-S-isoprenylcysteine O-methyltransferase Ste14